MTTDSITSASTEQPPAGDELFAGATNTARSSVVVSATTFLATAIGGGFAISITLILGAGADTDGFFAAYSAYTAFIVFGTTMRVALVPQLGDASDPARFRANARDRIGRILPISFLTVSCSPRWRRCSESRSRAVPQNAPAQSQPKASRS